MTNKNQESEYKKIFYDQPDYSSRAVAFSAICRVWIPGLANPLTEKDSRERLLAAYRAFKRVSSIKLL